MADVTISKDNRSIPSINIIETPTMLNTNISTRTLNRTKTNYYMPTQSDSIKSQTSEIMEWNRIGPESSNSIIGYMAVDPQEHPIIYAISQFEPQCECSHFKALYKSNDMGVTWERIHKGLEEDKIGTISIDPVLSSTLYLSGTRGVYKSIDGGINWSIKSTGLLIGHIIGPVVIDPTIQSTLYIGGAHIFKSINGGLSWDIVDNDINNIIDSIAIDPHNSNNVYAGGNGLYRSKNAGITWESCFNTVVHSIVIDPQTPSIVYAGTDIGVLKSIDSGNTWNWINNGLGKSYTISLLIDPSEPSIIYAGTRNGVFRTQTGGTIWNYIGLGEYMISSILLLFTPENILLVSTRGGGIAFTYFTD
jgi:photosystem II stability/assembly factor-like uncharacterized protein